MGEVKKPGKRIIIPSSRGQMQTVERVQSISNTVEDAKITIANEIGRWKDKSMARSLDLPEARVLSQLIDSLVKLSKEEREVAKAFDTENMTDEELQAEMEKILKEAKDRKHD